MVCLSGFIFFFQTLCVYGRLEVLLNSRSEVLDCMIGEGILRVIGDIIVNETDALVLVCLLSFFTFLPSCFYSLFGS